MSNIHQLVEGKMRSLRLNGMLDTLNLKLSQAQQAKDFYKLVNQRYRSSSMIVTANRSPKDWYPLFPNPVIAESALDRLVSCSDIITLTGKSYQ